MPNWRIGGKSESASARNPLALMRVANRIGRPATSRAYRTATPRRTAVNGPPLASRGCAIESIAANVRLRSAGASL
jgi:hypothetical protein